jgi:hypothetical protein
MEISRQASRLPTGSNSTDEGGHDQVNDMLTSVGTNLDELAL